MDRKERRLKIEAMIQEGKTNGQIAHALLISANTVASARHRLRKRAGSRVSQSMPKLKSRSVSGYFIDPDFDEGGYYGR